MTTTVHVHAAFIDAADALASDIHEVAIEKGWWTHPRNDGEVIALIHSEASELLEGLRHGNGPSDHIPEFLASEEELADIIIRCLDYGVARDWRVAEAVVAKLWFNAGRPHMHGGKAF